MNCIATIGFFDGVHIGHQYVLRELQRYANMLGCSPLVVTFPEHPAIDLGRTPPPLLTTFIEREQRLRQQGIDDILFLPFAQIKVMTAKQFMQFLRSEHQVTHLLMGYDHQFGSDQPHNFDYYRQCGLEVGIEVILLEEHTDNETHVSSTTIRHLIQHGKIEDANRLLGYDYMLSGKVVHGKQIGRQLGFPTANIELPTEKVIPAEGVYETRVEDIFAFKLRDLGAAVTNIGTNPTFGTNSLTCEVHLINSATDLYDKILFLQFRRFIRSEQTFSSSEELIKQIKHDICTVQYS